MYSPLSCYVSLGSNDMNAKNMLSRAILMLASLENIVVGKLSRIFYTEPQGYRNQPWFFNRILELHPVGWTPAALLQKMLDIEQLLGRRRTGPRFGPRNIDIDLLLFGEQSSDDVFCLLPHPRMLERAFVLLPLAEINSNLMISGVSVRDCLARLQYRVCGAKIYQNNFQEDL